MRNAWGLALASALCVLACGDDDASPPAVDGGRGPMDAPPASDGAAPGTDAAPGVDGAPVDATAADGGTALGDAVVIMDAPAPIDAGAADACARATCATLAAMCGTYDDGCGATFDCGGCTAPETCGGGPIPRRCGCTPTTCAAAGVECGTTANGCGGTLDCGACVAPETCGGAGVAGQCGCTPTATCASIGASCGVHPDDCNLPLDCGMCVCTRETVATMPTEPAVGENAGGGSRDWMNPGNISRTRFGSATVNVSPSLPSSRSLLGRDYGFTLPPDAMVLGIEVRVTRSGSGNYGALRESVGLVQRGAFGGVSRATVTLWSGFPTTVTFGSPTDLWGRTWTPVDINRSDFGATVRVFYEELSGNATASVSVVSVTVHYTRCLP